MTPEGLQESREPVPLAFAPGYFTEATDRTARGRWKGGDRVRFHNGLPQKVGGWESTTFTGATMRGIPRGTHEWVSLDGESWIALGTSKKLFLLNRGVRYDITPVRISGTLGNDPFAVTDGSAIVTVSHTAHGAREGDFVRYSGATAGGGITIDGEYEIVEVLDNNSYTIEHSAAATSTDASTGGAAVTYEYDISIGFESNQIATGYGTGPYGAETYGTPRTASASTLVQTLRVWSLDNFGEDLLASPNGGALYRWDKSGGTSSRAALLSDAPDTSQRVLMSGKSRRVVCLGAYDPVGGASDPLNIIVGAAEALDEFEVVDDSSDVYTERVSQGSTLVGGLLTAGGIFVWSDKASWMLVPDPSEIYRLVDVATGNSIAGPNAAVDVNGTIYGMASDKFVLHDGVYRTLPSDVWSYVFDNERADTPGINKAQLFKVCAWHNETFSEVWWFYPSRDSDENDRAVIYNYNDNCWYTMSLERTAALERGPSYGVPVAMDAAGTVYLHETGVDDDGAAMGEYIESFDSELGEGKTSMAVTRLIPDLTRFTGTLLVTLKMKGRPRQETYREKGPYTLTPTTEEMDVRATGRQVALHVAGSGTGGSWRMGPFRAYVQEDAERA